MASRVWEELNLTEDGPPTTLISGKTQVVLKSEGHIVDALHLLDVLNRRGLDVTTFNIINDTNQPLFEIIYRPHTSIWTGSAFRMLLLIFVLFLATIFQNGWQPAWSQTMDLWKSLMCPE